MNARAVIVYGLRTLSECVQTLETERDVAGYISDKHHGSGSPVVALPEEWLARFVALCAEATKLADEVDAMQRYKVVQVTRLKFGDAVVHDVEQPNMDRL